MSSDYTKPYTDVVNYLPPRYRNPFNTSWYQNLHDKFLTKDESTPVLGYVGDAVAGDTSPYIAASDLDRSINALIPTVYTKLGAEEYVFTFEDVLAKLELMGIDTTQYATWGAIQNFNFAPPIDLDMFSNYTAYRWYGHLLNVSETYNPTMTPEYYVIAKGGVSDWSTGNYWVHSSYAPTFFESQGWTFTIDSTIQAIRPIICFPVSMETEMVLHSQNGVPSSTGVEIDQTVPGYKTSLNQKPLFNLYLGDGTHAGLVSPIFYYQEGNEFPIDATLQIRAALNATGDYLFAQGLVTSDGSRIFFYKNNAVLQSAWAFGTIDVPVYYMPDANGDPIPGDPTTDLENVGAWNYPNAMFYNITHENRKVIAFGDLFSHFTSIISSQPGFTGNPYGVNNYRTLPSINLGLGGKIKDYKSNFALFLGLTNQLDNSVLSIIDFAKQQYAQMITAVSEYTQRNIAEAITSGVINVPSSILSNTIDSTLTPFYNQFLTYLTTRGNSSVFADTTSGIANYPATLPYFGMGALIQPQIYFDAVAGSLYMRFHDGHISPITTSNVTLENEIANIAFQRSDGQITPGVVGYNKPAKPYKNQFWFDTNTNTLKTYAVASDVWPTANTGVDGSYYYDRVDNVLYQYNLIDKSFNVVSNLDLPWEVVNTSAVVAQLILMVETQLYNGCPTETQTINANAVITANGTAAQTLLEQEFAVWAAARDLDMTAADYDPTNAFTWNYKKAQIFGVGSGAARWYTIYQAYFGVARPNLQPWVLQGYTSMPPWWMAMYGDTTGTRTWTTKMWTDILNNSTPGYPAPNGGWGKKLCVDVTNDNLLPPYVSPSDQNSVQALLTVIPPGIADSYVYGDVGPIELEYNSSVEYNYDKLKVCFKLDPINFVAYTWGTNIVVVDGYSIDRHEQRKISYTDLILHGETPTPKVNGFTVTNISQSPNALDTAWTLTCVSLISSGSIFSIVGNKTGLIEQSYTSNAKFTNVDFTVEVSDNGADFNIGDQLVIAMPSQTVTYIQTQYAKFAGLNQWFVNLNRCNSVDLSIALANNILRGWDLLLAHRMSGLIDTTTFSVATDSFPIHNTDYNIVIKENKNVGSYWLNAIRVQLIQIGSTTFTDGNTVPANKGADWQFRIETFNTYNPTIEYYQYDPNGAYQTFYAYGKQNSTDTWNHLLDRTNLVTQTMPFVVTGIENVANVIFGYVDKLNEDGWLFNQGDNPSIDPATGRSINWQLYIERFINQQYLGVQAGTGVILNPFSTAVWFQTPTGFVANMRNPTISDVSVSQVIFDSFGQTIPNKSIQITRNDSMTLIESDIVIGGVHLLVDEYEHIVLFNDYTYQGTYLLYDPFLGVRVNRLYMSANRQTNFNGRLSFGGHYVDDTGIKRNIEASVSDMLNYYDADKMIEGSATADHARALLGYQGKQYMTDLNLSDRSQFGFWRGLISNKGSNLSVTAFLNSTQFQEAEIDEFWAYKLATYGDSRQLAYPEIILNSVDAANQFTKIQFNASDDPLVQALGFINISPLDESRWIGPVTDDTDLTFDAELLAELKFSNVWPNTIYNLELNNKPVIADAVQVYELVYMNSGDMTPFWIRVQNFELVNSSTIIFTADTVDLSVYTLSSPRQFKVNCFGPSQPKFNPGKLINYQEQVIVSELNLWDPARGAHVPEALEIVDIISGTDPAKYNYSVRTADNINYDPYHQWDDVQIGKILWNTQNLSYIPYADTSIFPSLDTRLAYWGALADWSAVNVYEWVESTVHPSDYATLVSQQQGDSTIPVDQQASGTVAMTDLYARTRTWQQRPVAWAYADAPGAQTPYLNSVGEYQVAFRTDLAGNTMAILSSNDWVTEFPSLAVGNKISGGVFHYNTFDVSDVDNFKLTKPYGEAVVSGVNQDLYIGSSASFDTPVFTPPLYTFTQ